MANLQTQTSSGTVMGRSTAQNQRKVKIPAGLKKRLKKVRAEKAVEVPAIKMKKLPAVVKQPAVAINQATSKHGYCGV